MFPAQRPRRLRTSAAMRRMVAETTVRPSQLVLPMFVKEGATEPVPIETMPGVVQHTRDSLRNAAVEAVQAGVGGLMLFGVPEHKDAVGSGGVDPNGVLNVALRDLRSELGDETVLMSDLC
ncbi:MAG: porphobilinogen synthase, partial [Actinomycetes bacterium]